MMKNYNISIKKAAQSVGADIGGKLHSSNLTQLHCTVTPEDCQVKHALLPERFQECFFPNIAAEICMHNAGHPDAYARWANITPDLLTAFMEGREDLELAEFWGIVKLSRFLTSVPCSHGYLLCRQQSYYDLSIQKHYRKVRAAYRKYENLHPVDNTRSFDQKAIWPFEKVKQQGVISRARLNNVLRYIEHVERDIADAANKRKPRGVAV